MKHLKFILLLLVISFLTVSCFKDNDDELIADSQINDFVWKGMNIFYLYKDNSPDLANDRFSSDEAYADYLNSFSNPEDLFESLIYERQTFDKFSWIVDDYIALEQLFSGVTLNNGMEFSLFLQPNSSTQVFGIVRLVLPNSDALAKGVKRGDVFNAINGISLDINNYSNLLANTNYAINLANYNDNGTTETTDDNITSTNLTINLTKAEYAENPIFKSDVISVNGENVGYLMYNGFTANYDSQLNAVFNNFKSNNVQHLILDLRYNSGGSVNSAILLSSMITGQFNGEIFSTEQWNSEFQNYFLTENPEYLINRFTNKDGENALNSLNLNKVYIIALESSASASELVINSLDPYIDVVHIGENTAGKYQASTTLYDSNDFSKNGVNPRHSYAMQPLIFKSLNKVGNTDYFNGLTPDIILSESYLNLGVIGDVNEKLLAAALSDIEGTSGKQAFNGLKKEKLFKKIKDSHTFMPFYDDMHTDKKLPSVYTQKN